VPASERMASLSSHSPVEPSQYGKPDVTCQRVRLDRHVDLEYSLAAIDVRLDALEVRD
jgi:hypothetical protein